MRALIVDDEPPARRRLARLLGAIEDVEVVGEAEDGLQALERVRALRPDVVFLDIHMPALDGVTLAQRHSDLPTIVFVTADDAHAVRAFEVNAVDYLLKPVRPERLARTIARLRSRPPVDGVAVGRVLDDVAPPRSRVFAVSRGLVRFFEAAQLTRFWAAHKYTLFRGDGEEQLTEEPLDSLEARLAPLGFFRVHRAELVRIAAVKTLRSADGIYEVELDDGQVARVSRRAVAVLRSALGL